MNAGREAYPELAADPFPLEWSCGEFLGGLRIILSLFAAIASPVPRNRRSPSPMPDTLASNAPSRDADLVIQVARGDEREHALDLHHQVFVLGDSRKVSLVIGNGADRLRHPVLRLKILRLTLFDQESPHPFLP